MRELKSNQFIFGTSKLSIILSIGTLKKTFFISDFHFGINGLETSRSREKLFLQWIDRYANDMAGLYILGDLFDFWFEYKHVVPKGGVQVLAALATLKDSGVPVHLFSGNHDQWMFDYIPQELGIPVYHEPIEITIHNKKIRMGHGDGLGPGDHGYKFIKSIFKNSVARGLFSAIPPGIGMTVARYWSGASRRKGIKENVFLGEEKEWLIQYCKEQIIIDNTIDYFIFGHRHLPIDWRLNNTSRYINLGDWLRFHSFATLNDKSLVLSGFTDAELKIYSNH